MKNKVDSTQLFIGIIFLFVIISVMPYLTGSATMTYAKTPGSVCTDTDGGQDYNNVGVAKDANWKFTDACKSDTILTEYYCNEDGEVTKEDYTCPSGSDCFNGECVKSLTQCDDGDGGRYFFVKGTTTLGSGSYTDYCKDHDTVVEFYCTNMGDEIRNADVNCAYGCADGACIHSNA